MAIGLVALGWALSAVGAVGAGAGVSLGVVRKKRRILRRGARLTAEITAVESARIDGPLRSDRRNVRLELRFAGLEEHPLEFLGYRLRAEDAAVLVLGATVQVWVLPDDLSEVRVARPDGAGRTLPFQPAPEMSGSYGAGAFEAFGSLLEPLT
jgi:hypothetical protein